MIAGPAWQTALREEHRPPVCEKGDLEMLLSSSTNRGNDDTRLPCVSLLVLMDMRMYPTALTWEEAHLSLVSLENRILGGPAVYKEFTVKPSTY